MMSKVDATKFRAITEDNLGLADNDDAADFYDVTDRTLRRWRGGHPLPRSVMMLLAIMIEKKLTVAQVNKLLDKHWP